MKLINQKTGETIREGLTPADVRALYDRGVRSLLGEDAEAGGGGGGGESLPSDVEPPESDDAAPGEADGEESDADAEPTDLDADALADAIEEMERADRERSSGDWFGVGDEDYTEADDEDVRRFERLQRRIDENRTPIGQRRAERDERLGTARLRSDTVREHLRQSGIAEDVEAAFRKLKTQDYPEPSDDGAELHLDGYIRHLAGDYAEDEFYLDHEPVEAGDRAVAVALDMSGSMDELDAKMALGALAVATRAIGDELVASAFFTSRSGGRKKPRTTLITGPGEGFEWDHLDAVKTDDLTPTPSGIADAKTLLDGTTKREKVLIVITDGAANITTDGQKSENWATEEAAQMVNRLRAEGVKVIGFGVEPVEVAPMERTFGEDGYVMARSEDMAEALVAVYKRQMKVA